MNKYVQLFLRFSFIHSPAKRNLPTLRREATHKIVISRVIVKHFLHRRVTIGVRLSDFINSTPRKKLRVGKNGVGTDETVYRFGV